MSFENLITVPNFPFKKRKIKIEWLTILATILSLFLGVAATSSGLLRDYYNQRLEEKKLNLEVLKAIKSDYKEDHADFAKRVRTISMVQIFLVEAIEFCRTNKEILDKDELARKELQKKQNNLTLVFNQFLNESIDLETRYGKEVHQKAQVFAKKVKTYKNACQAEIPSETDWIKWQNDIVFAMSKSLEKKYNQYQTLIIKNLE